MKLYGIRNCDTVKKARAWLDARGVAYDYHDYRIAGIDAATLDGWVDRLGWDRLLNRAGTTFRKIGDADKADLDAKKAVALMLSHPSAIRRPVLESGAILLVGFSPERYEAAGLGAEELNVATATWNDVVIARSGDTVVVEGNHYFPADTVDVALFEDSATQSICPWKGVAHYKTIVANGVRNPDAAWFYPDPKSEAAAIKGRYAFWKGVIIT